MLLSSLFQSQNPNLLIDLAFTSHLHWDFYFAQILHFYLLLH